MATLEVLLLALGLMFLVVILMRMDRAYTQRKRERDSDANPERDAALDEIIAERQRQASHTEKEKP